MKSKIATQDQSNSKQRGRKPKLGYQEESQSQQQERKSRSHQNESNGKSQQKEIKGKSLQNESKGKSQQKEIKGNSVAKKNSLKHSPAIKAVEKLTPIKDITPMVMNISVKARVLSVWHGHRLNHAHEPYSLECVLQDEEGERIQVYVKKDWMFRFEPLLQDGICYVISNFGVVENGGKLPLLPHDWKISFYKNTNVTRIDHFNDDFLGFKSEPFSRILDPDNEYADKDVVDVIGTVVGIGEVVAVNSIGSSKIRRTVVIENEHGERIDLTFWDAWAKKWNQYAEKLDTIGHIDLVLMFGKVKYFNNSPSVHNALFGTQLYINRQLDVLLSFRERYESREEYDATQQKIELVAHAVKVVTPQEFMTGAVRKNVGSIRETEPDSECVIYAIVHSIQYESRWTYIGCKSCSKKVEPVVPKGPATSKTKQTWWCTTHHSQSQVANRYKMIVRVVDESGTAQLCIFDGNMYKMSGFTAWELVEKYGPDTATYFPDELNGIIGKKFLFRIKFSEFNHNNNSHVYRCEKVTTDSEIISYWKRGFHSGQDTDEDSENGNEYNIEEDSEQDSEHEMEHDSEGDGERDSQEDGDDDCEDDSDDMMTTPSVPKKSSKRLDLSLTRRLQLQTPTSASIGSSSGHSSGSKKRRRHTIKRSIVVIDLSDSEFDTDDEQETNGKKKMLSNDKHAIDQKSIVKVKIEKDESTIAHKAEDNVNDKADEHIAQETVQNDADKNVQNDAELKE